MQGNVQGKQETLQDARTPHFLDNGGKPEYSCGTTVRCKAAVTHGVLPTSQEEKCHRTGPSAQMETAICQAAVTYGIRLGPPASVDLFQENIEQPPEIQRLQKNKRNGCWHTAPLGDAARIQPALVKRSTTRAAKGGRVAPRAHRLRPVEPGAAQDVGSEPGAGRQSPAQRSDSAGQRPATPHRSSRRFTPLALRVRSTAPSALRERALQRPLQGGRAESRSVVTSWPHPKRFHGAALPGRAVLCFAAPAALRAERGAKPQVQACREKAEMAVLQQAASFPLPPSATALSPCG